MYFKDFPSFLYDFNLGDGKVKTSVVKDITRNIRFRKEILQNITAYDYYDIVDGETPEIIADKFYGSPEYHWVIMIANGIIDYASDLPMQESILQKHIEKVYNPKLYSDDWYWDIHDDGKTYVHLKISYGQTTPFDVDYLTAPMKVTLYDATKTYVKILDFPTDYIGLDAATQYFVFEYSKEDMNTFGPISNFGTGDDTAGYGSTRIYIETEGRENNPIYFLNSLGVKVNPTQNGVAVEGLIPYTGAQAHRAENDMKRRIKIISPSLLEVIIKNYDELL